MTIREQYEKSYATLTIAAAALAHDLMQDNPVEHKTGYTEPNAILAALEVFPECEGAAVMSHMNSFRTAPAPVLTVCCLDGLHGSCSGRVCVNTSEGWHHARYVPCQCSCH